MKFLAFIMSFLVLALSVMPCADNEGFLKEGKSKAELTKPVQPHNENEQDDCSPFCTCTCCAGFSINHFIAAMNSIPSYESMPVASFLSSEVIEIAFPIWQPPQLV